MKIKKRFVFYPILIIFALVYVYANYINVFNKDTLESITIAHTDALDATFFELSNETAHRLYQNLESGVKADVFPENGSTFKMTLLNKWHLSKHLKVVITEDGEVFFQDENKSSIYRLNQKDFFYDHEGFDAHYKVALFPTIDVKTNSQGTPFAIQNHQWFFKRLSGTWVQNNSAQQLFNEGTTEITSDKDEIFVYASKAPDLMSLSILNKQTNQVVWTGAHQMDRPLFVPDQNGDYQYMIELEWLGEQTAFKGNALISLSYEVKLPASFDLSKSELYQDDFLMLTAKNVSDLSHYHVVQPFIDDFKWFENNGVFTAILPVNYKVSPGEYTLSIIDLNTDEGTDFTVNVLERTYKVQNLTVSSSTVEATRNDEAFAEYRMYFAPVRETSQSQRFFDETPFLLPVSGRLTTEFGEKRNVNGSLTSYRHTGIDIAAPLGTPVQATHNGIIAFQMDMMLTGKTIIIDHGQGLFSVYEHLDDISVQTGDFVSKGDVIGTVGSTGFSTGPHLHFMISYHQHDLDPGYFIIGEAYTKEKHSDLRQ